MSIKLTRNGVDSAPTAPLTDGVGSVLDWEVHFPLAGYAGPGFHTWPSGHIPQDTAPNPLFRIRPPGKKTFGAATGVSEPVAMWSSTRETRGCVSHKTLIINVLQKLL